MEHKPVKSSNIESHAYDPETMTLELRFRGQSSTYSYANVPKHVYEGLISADSVGGYFHKRIKGQFDFTKVGAKD